MRPTQRLKVLVAVLLTCGVGAPGCATKSSRFVGIHFIGEGRAAGAVAESAATPVDAFAREWLSDWEQGHVERCYARLSRELQQTLSVERLQAIRSELQDAYGHPHETLLGVDLPLTAAFPQLDEALFKTTPSETLRFYNYVLAQYLSRRPMRNLIYVIGVGMDEETFRVVTFGIQEHTFNPTEAGATLYWFGYLGF